MLPKKILFLIIPILIALLLGGGTYAFWSSIIASRTSIIYTGELSFNVNQTDGLNQLGVPLSINNLYPSDYYYVEDSIEIKNTGTMAIKYRIRFDCVQDDYNLSYFTLVSFNEGETWVPLISAEYLEVDHPLGVNESIKIPVQFRLSKAYAPSWDINQITRFNVVVNVVQYEDSLESSVIYMDDNKRDMNETFGVVKLVNFNPSNFEEVIFSDSLETKGVTIDFEDDESVTFGSWMEKNSFKIVYNANTQTIFVDVNGVQGIYSIENQKPFQMTQIRLYNHNNNGELKISQLKINNRLFGGSYVSSTEGTLWNFSGTLLNENNEFVIEGVLTISGHHPSLEHSKIEFLFGN